jgi:hypothetical protein
MREATGGDTERVVVTSFSFLLNVLFGTIELLIKSKNVSRPEIIKLLETLRGEAAACAEDEAMALELIDGALYRLDPNYHLASAAPKAAKAALKTAQAA